MQSPVISVMEICGCGRPAVYSKSLPDGTFEYSCNKYGRCLSPEEQAEKDAAFELEKKEAEAREVELAYQRFMNKTHNPLPFSNFKEIFASVIEYRQRQRKPIPERKAALADYDFTSRN